MTQYEVINTILTFLGLGALMWTIIVNNNQINETRQDAHRDRFENTLFNMVERHHSILPELSFPMRDGDEEKIFVGKELMAKWISNYIEQAGPEPQLRAYSGFFPRFKPYFVSLSNILTYINDAESLDAKTKEFFSRYIMTTLSQEEKYCYYHVILAFGFPFPESSAIERLKEYEQKYQFLKNDAGALHSFYIEVNPLYLHGIYPKSEVYNNKSLVEEIDKFEITLKQQKAAYEKDLKRRDSILKQSEKEYKSKHK